MEPLLHNQLYTTFPMAAPSRTFLLFLIPIPPFLYKSSFPLLLLIRTSISIFSLYQWLLPLFSQPLSSFLYSSPLSSSPPLLLTSTNQLTLPGVMVVLRSSTMATFSLFPSTRPPALAFSQEMSISMEKSICKSSSFLAIPPALSLPTT